MRALRVVGLDDGGALVCECTERGERFTLPADETLRAAARGELTRVRQAEPTKTEPENQMRPREIQARIRAGESVEQVAAVSGLPAEKVDRFAYPVLLERSRTAELAQHAHPVRPDGPDVRTLGEVVASTFSQRGQDYSAVLWDSWRGDDGKWIVQLQWQAGRSENRAHWTFHPGAHGGTVTTLDDFALDLIDPEAGISLRTIRPVTPLAEQALRVDEAPRRPERAERVERSERVERVDRQERAEPPARRTEPAARRTEPAARRTEAKPEQPTLDTPAADAEPAAAAPIDEPAEQPAAVAEPAQKATGTTEASPSRRGKRNHPIVPSWEDVLLGVRSNR